MSLFYPANPSLFFSKNDPDDPRFGEVVVRAEMPDDLNEWRGFAGSQPPSWWLIGYPDDQGIELNGGRSGAREAPDTIRKYFYKTTPQTKDLKLIDAGNLATNVELDVRHDTTRIAAESLLAGGGRLISMGGGHDYGYPDGKGFLGAMREVFGSQIKPLIINFDAHLDVRPHLKHAHSGTSFYRLLTEFKDQFDFVEIGLQRVSTSLAHIRWAESHGAHLIFNEGDETAPEWLSRCQRQLTPLLTQKRPVFLSFDIDVLEHAAAPGASQSWPLGLPTIHAVKTLRWVWSQSDVRHFGVYEISPRLDVDDRTSKLAAQLIHRLIHDVGCSTPS